jgi:hypothetical protein
MRGKEAVDMLRTHENNPKAKAVDTNIKIYDRENELIRIVGNAKLDGFADEVDLPDGIQAYNIAMVPIRIKGAEAVWTEGEGETIFVWDCRNELGEPVKQGVYRIDVKQADAFGNVNTVSAAVSIKEKDAV